VAEIKTFFLEGPAGRLEAVLNAGTAGAKYAALVCHPHPLYGGTLHNKVVYNAMKALHGFGFPVLRFNFRGAGLSEGTHDHGEGELGDVRTALDWLDSEFHLPLIFCGFSFGAATGMRAACPDGRVKAIISLGTPAEVDDRLYRYSFLSDCTKPKLFISGDRDQFAPKQKLQEVFAEAAEPKKIVFVQGAEHFFEKKLDLMQTAIREWLPSVLPL
jgi:alpha/beta superfamily hydrolase